jgi:hypothetical protein
MAGGLFVLSGVIRDLCAKKLLRKYSRRENVQCFDVLRLYSSYLNNGDIKQAADVPNRAGKAWRLRHDGFFQLMSHFAEGKSLGDFSKLQKFDIVADRLFYEMVTGKSIAVLGPSAGSLNVDEIIQDFDLIVRITYRGKEFLSEDARQCGVDVSYYSNVTQYAKTRSEFMQFARDYKMGVFGVLHFDYQKELILEGLCRVRRASADYLMFQGSENMVQAILIDLFHFAPARIKLFNVNLYLANADNLYHNGYSLVNEPPSNGILWRAHSYHNITSNYEVTKFLFDSGYFEADDELKYILSLGTGEYLHRMELVK